MREIFSSALCHRSYTKYTVARLGIEVGGSPVQNSPIHTESMGTRYYSRGYIHVSCQGVCV